MNLYLRLFFMFALVRFRSRISLFGETLVTKHIVWPNDLDPLGHMNNGRYFTITDLARIEMLVRAGLWQAMRARGQIPLMAGETIQFRRPLKPFQRYEIRTRPLGWDDKFFYIEHRFQREDELYALVLVKVRVVGKSRSSPADTLRYVYSEVSDSNMNRAIELWNASSNTHWTETVSEAA